MIPPSVSKKKRGTISTRVESHVIREGHAFYSWAVAECAKSAALYNRVNYIYRQAYTRHLENIPEYADLVREDGVLYGYDVISRMRKLRDADYYGMTKSASAGQTVLQVDQAWKAWRRAQSAYSKYPGNFAGRPRIPGYKHAKGRARQYVVTYSANDARLQADGRILIRRGLYLPLRTRVTRLRQVRLVPCPGCIRIDVVYEKKLSPSVRSSDRALGIDIGVNNLMAITSNEGRISTLVNGRPLKSMFRYYRRALAAAEPPGGAPTRRINRLHMKYAHKVRDFMHKASRRVAQLAAQHGAGRCYIGIAPGWSAACRTRGKVTSLPLQMLVNMLQYKLEEQGVRVLLRREEYSSRCSFLDGEPLCAQSRYLGRRVQRGLFVSGDGRAINADIHASLNILRRGLGHSFPAYGELFQPVYLDINSKRLNLPCR